MEDDSNSESGNISVGRKSGGMLKKMKKVFGGDAEALDSPTLKRRSRRGSVFGLGNTLRSTRKEKTLPNRKSISLVSFDPEEQDKMEEKKEVPKTRTQRSLSVSNLKKRMSLNHKAENNDSPKEGRSRSNSQDKKFERRLERTRSERINRSLIAKPTKDEESRPRGSSYTSELTPLIRDPKPKFFDVSVVPCFENAQAILSALSSSSANLRRILSAEDNQSKLNKILGTENKGRVRASSTHSVAAVNTLSILEGAESLGEAIAMMVSKTQQGNCLPWIRESLARIRNLDELLRPEYDRGEDGREWKEVFSRFAAGLLRLYAVLEAYVRNPESAAVRVRVLTVIEELRGPGYYLKGLLSGALINPDSEKILLSCNDSLRLSSAIFVSKALSVFSGNTPELKAMAESLSKVSLLVSMLSPVACTVDAAEFIVEACDDAINAVEQVATLIKGLEDNQKIARLDVTVSKLRQQVRQVRQATGTSISMLKTKIISNTYLITLIGMVVCNLVEVLQKEEGSTLLSLVTPLCSRLALLCEHVRKGLSSGSKIHQSIWVSVHKNQKKILADSMLCERNGKTLLTTTPEKYEDALDALTLSSVRLKSSVESYISSHVGSEHWMSDPEQTEALCGLVEHCVEKRNSQRPIIAQGIAFSVLLERNLKALDAAIQRSLFDGCGQVNEAMSNVMEAWDNIDGLRFSSPLSPWQSMSPSEQLRSLPEVWDTPMETLIARFAHIRSAYGNAMAEGMISEDVRTVLQPTFNVMCKGLDNFSRNGIA